VPSSFDADQLRRDHPLSDYLPARGIAVKPEGREFRCLCPFHAERTPSFQIYQGRKGTQEFHCKGCDAKGDVIQFVERYDGATFAEACEILGGTREPNENRAPVAPAEPAVDIYAAWTPAMPPKGTLAIRAGERTPPLENPKRGNTTRYTPAAVHRYNDEDGRFLAFVLRVEIDGKKLTPLIQWCENVETGVIGWCHRPFIGARPLYRLHQLATRPDAQVLVVEGEKCADAAQALLPRLVVTTWQGGGKAAGKSNWKPVSGRDVLIWPDADPEGLDAAQEAGRLATEAGARSVRVISIPADKPKGWDIADAIEAGWTKADVVAFARAGARPWGEPRETTQTAPEPPAADERRFDEPPAERDGERERLTRPALRPVTQEKPQPEPESKPANVIAINPKAKHWENTEPDEYDEHGRHWISYLHSDGKGQLKRRDLENWEALLRHHPRMRGVFSQDAMTDLIYVAKRPPWEPGSKPWRARVLQKTDAGRAQIWLATALDEFNQKPTTSGTQQAIELVANANRYDPAREYLERLEREKVWDGIPRLSTWLTEYMGVEPTEGGIEAAFGTRWVIAMVARNLTENERGEKADTALVFEGDQGVGKSMALENFATMDGQPYHTSAIVDVTNKDTVQLTQGVVLAVFDEFTAVADSDPAAVKNYMEKSIDNVRLPYAAAPVALARRFVLAATINPTGRGYLKDVTGGRRFWPVRVCRQIDQSALADVREQLHAEAVNLYRKGEQWWLTPEEEELAKVEQAKRLVEDPWAEQLDEWLYDNPREVTVRAAFTVLMILTDRHDPAREKRITDHFHARGYVAKQKNMAHGRTKTVYVKRDQK
jgi:hypothetical protein